MFPRSTVLALAFLAVGAAAMKLLTDQRELRREVDSLTAELAALRGEGESRVEAVPVPLPVPSAGPERLRVPDSEETSSDLADPPNVTDLESRLALLESAVSEIRAREEPDPFSQVATPDRARESVRTLLLDTLQDPKKVRDEHFAWTPWQLYSRYGRPSEIGYGGDNSEVATWIYELPEANDRVEIQVWYGSVSGIATRRR